MPSSEMHRVNKALIKRLESLQAEYAKIAGVQVSQCEMSKLLAEYGIFDVKIVMKARRPRP